jgi:anti-sigma factor RsiW
VTHARGHEELRGLLGPYVLDAVDDLERAAVEAHLEGCVACRQERAQLEQAAAMLPPASRPPEDLWKRIVEEVQAIEDEQEGRRGGGRSEAG